jgi:hypothetical protein
MYIMATEVAPQAKGRVECLNKTLQDRLVKELRLSGTDTVESASPGVPREMKMRATGLNLRTLGTFLGRAPRQFQRLSR